MKNLRMILSALTLVSMSNAFGGQTGPDGVVYHEYACTLLYAATPADELDTLVHPTVYLFAEDGQSEAIKHGEYALNQSQTIKFGCGKGEQNIVFCNLTIPEKEVSSTSFFGLGSSFGAVDVAIGQENYQFACGNLDAGASL